MMMSSAMPTMVADPAPDQQNQRGDDVDHGSRTRQDGLLDLDQISAKRREQQADQQGRLQDPVQREEIRLALYQAAITDAGADRLEHGKELALGIWFLAHPLRQFVAETGNGCLG